MSNGSSSVAVRYGAAILAISLATALRLLLDPLLGNLFPFATLFFAILLVAWQGGFGPALTATLSGAFLASFFLLPPRMEMAIEGFADRAGFVLYLLVGIGISILGRSMQRALQRAESRADEALEQKQQFEHVRDRLQQQRQELKVTLTSIGDAVITTDPQGYVTFLNPVAQELTGWRYGEAAGRPLADIFKIINEQTREPVESPVDKVLRLGGIVGLANHTILIAKDGTEVHIDDSAAPIRDEKEDLLGVVLVFRDASLKRSLEIEQRRLAAIMASSEDAILGQTFSGVLTHWNEGAERLFGWPADEAVGQSIFSLVVPPDRKEELLDILQRVQRGESVQPFETIRCRKDGRILPVSVRISPIRDAEGRIVAASAIDRDISRQQAYERRRNARLAVTQTLAREQDETQAIDQVLESICTALQWDAGTFWKVEPQTGTLRCRNFRQSSPQDLDEFRDASSRHAFEPGDSLPGRVWRSEQAVWIADVTVDPHFQRVQEAKKAGLHGAFACPVAVGTNFLGVFEFFSQEIQAPDPDLLEMMATISGQIGQFFEQLDSEAALRRQTERLKLLWEAAAVLLTASNPDAMMKALFSQVSDHLGADAYFNFVADENAEALRLVSCIGIPEESAREIERLEFGRAVCGTVALERRPIVATHIQQSDDPKVQLVKSFGIRAYACNPLMADGQLIGTLSFASRTKDQFDDGELSFFETLSRYVTFAYIRLRLLERLQDADRRKDDFLATLAHELRNPLAPIRNGLQVIRMAKDDKQMVEQARGMMERQLEQMVRLIDDLLDISRITRNKLELRKENVELKQVIDSAVETSQHLIDQGEHQLTVSLPPESILVEADPTRLSQIFANLLNNAAKYTENGGRIRLTVERQGSDAIISVRDTGIGIAAEHLPKLFEMFSQVAPALERSQGGLGIGLALVRGLVDMHGGSIEARSEGLGKGSEFIVRLPVLIAHSTAVKPPESAPDTAAAQPKQKILVVDDNKDAAKMLAMTLQLLGHELHTVHDGEEAVNAAAALRPDVILLDIGLPKLNGYEACRRIRRQPDGDKINMIALTGWGQEGDKQKALQAGFDQHCTKPVDVSSLIPLLERSERIPG
ncbi:MAG: PAS domain S-box protein [Planctomycetaceae bacterium]